MPVDPERIRQLVKERPYTPKEGSDLLVGGEDRKGGRLQKLPPPNRLVFPLDCVHLGEPTAPPFGQSPTKEWYKCNAGKGTVCKCVCGAGKCDRYTADTSDPELVRAGVVIGHYGMPSLADLQIRLVRATCGDVPIIVADDHSPNAKELDTICTKHNVEVVRSGGTNIGHAGGDLGAVFRGLRWAKSKGLQVLCKLSQRFLITQDDWLQQGAQALMDSGLHTLSDSCIEGQTALPIRSEAMLLRVDRWGDDSVLKVIRPRRVYPYSAEAIYGLAMQRMGGAMGVWRLLGGPDRGRKAANTLWHCNTTEAEYRTLATKFGVDLGADFFTVGWPKNTTEDWG